MPQQPLIGVLDCNNFFVSCERLFRPDLRAKPVVVLSSNDGCIVARSQEIKDKGIPMGVPLFQVKDTLKDIGATTFSSNFTLYRDISRRVFAVMREAFDVVEQYSIDEAFFLLDATELDRVWQLKAQVERQVGVPVSLGIGHSKTQAKYANDRAKKTTGVAAWAEVASDVSMIALGDVWGVGRGLVTRFRTHGLHTIADLLAADSSRVAQLFGVSGTRLQYELQGRAVYRVGSAQLPQKSVMSSRSFASPTSSKAVLADALAYHVRHAAADLRAMQLEARYVRLFARPSRHGDYALRGFAREYTLLTYTNDTAALLRLITPTLEASFEAGVPYKKAGVLLAAVRPVGAATTPLFSDTEPAKQGAVWQAIDVLNQRYGRELVLAGSRLKTAAWQPRSAQVSPHYTTQWDALATVSAK